MFRKKIVIIFCLIILVCGVLLPLSYSNAGISLMDSIGGSCQSEGTCELNDFLKVFTFYANKVLGVVGSLALLMFIYGGVVLLISAGNSEKVTQGKQILIGAIIGIVIVFTSYMIIQFALKSLDVVNDEGNFKETGFDGKWDVAPKVK